MTLNYYFGLLDPQYVIDVATSNLTTLKMLLATLKTDVQELILSSNIQSNSIISSSRKTNFKSIYPFTNRIN